MISACPPYLGLQAARKDCAGVESPASRRPGGGGGALGGARKETGVAVL